MEDKDAGELARDYYLKGFGCAESVLHAFNDLVIINVPDSMLKVSTGFGTGFGGKGSTCGAIVRYMVRETEKIISEDNNK